MLAPSAWSHPHMSIDNSVTAVFDANGLAGFRLEWTFDEMSSSIFILDFDVNKNGRLEKSEIAALEKGAFSNLKNFEYFTNILTGLS
ncbi:MAG: DUF1007 family protein [Deltaproteobacteria bacterium]|nr:DUF1007 family protein [Deltaproteobacteria bacterium]